MSLRHILLLSFGIFMFLNPMALFILLYIDGLVQGLETEVKWTMLFLWAISLMASFMYLQAFYTERKQARSSTTNQY